MLLVISMTLDVQKKDKKCIPYYQFSFGIDTQTFQAHVPKLELEYDLLMHLVFVAF